MLFCAFLVLLTFTGRSSAQVDNITDLNEPGDEFLDILFPNNDSQPSRDELVKTSMRLLSHMFTHLDLYQKVVGKIGVYPAEENRTLPDCDSLPIYLGMVDSQTLVFDSNFTEAGSCIWHVCTHQDHFWLNFTQIHISTLPDVQKLAACQNVSHSDTCEISTSNYVQREMQCADLVSKSYMFLVSRNEKVPITFDFPCFRAKMTAEAFVCPKWEKVENGSVRMQEWGSMRVTCNPGYMIEEISEFGFGKSKWTEKEYNCKNLKTLEPPVCKFQCSRLLPNGDISYPGRDRFSPFSEGSRATIKCWPGYHLYSHNVTEPEVSETTAVCVKHQGWRVKDNLGQLLHVPPCVPKTEKVTPQPCPKKCTRFPVPYGEFGSLKFEFDLFETVEVRCNARYYGKVGSEKVQCSEQGWRPDSGDIFPHCTPLCPKFWMPNAAEAPKDLFEVGETWNISCDSGFELIGSSMSGFLCERAGWNVSKTHQPYCAQIKQCHGEKR